MGVAGGGLLLPVLAGCSATSGSGASWTYAAGAAVLAAVVAVALVRRLSVRPHVRAAVRAEQERSALVAERGVLLTEREELLREREDRETRLRTVMTEREALQGDRDRLAAEAAALRQERDELAVERDELQGSVDATFVNLAMRTLTLVERQLVLIETLEGREADPGQLDNLFRLDHLATRMRRNSENMLLLAGLENSRRSRETVPLLDVVRAAVSEIERYERVKLGFLPRLLLVGGAADDCSHLVAELLENATAFSPPHDQVDVGAWRLDNGEVMLSVTDRGIGMPAERMRELNEQLSAPDDPVDRRPGEWFGKALTGRSMGLFVVARLARRHGIRVQLRENAQGGGVTAMVVVPREIVVDEGVSPAEMDAQRRAERALAQPAQPAAPQGASWTPPAAGTAAGPVPGAAEQRPDDGALPPLPRRSPAGPAAAAGREHVRSPGESGAARHARRPDPEPPLAAPGTALPHQAVSEGAWDSAGSSGLPSEAPSGAGTAGAPDAPYPSGARPAGTDYGTEDRYGAGAQSGGGAPEAGLPALPRRTPRAAGLPGTGEAPLSGLSRFAAGGVPSSGSGRPPGGQDSAERGTSAAELRARLGGFQNGLRRAARERVGSTEQPPTTLEGSARPLGQAVRAWLESDAAGAPIAPGSAIVGAPDDEQPQPGAFGASGTGGDASGATGAVGEETGEVERAVGAPGEEDNG